MLSKADSNNRCLLLKWPHASYSQERQDIKQSGGPLRLLSFLQNPLLHTVLNYGICETQTTHLKLKQVFNNK